MPSYATTTSITHLLVRYLEDNSTGGDPFGESTTAAHINRAEARINAKLSARYSIPFSPVPPEIRRLTEDIACVYLIRASNYQAGQKKNEYLEEFKSAFDDLELIAKGEASLVFTDGSLVPPLSSGHFVSSDTNYTPIFGKDDPTQWERDVDEIDDQAARRSP